MVPTARTCLRFLSFLSAHQFFVAEEVSARLAMPRTSWHEDTVREFLAGTIVPTPELI